MLEELHELGVRIHLDDFGTGYSSLAYLARFPIDCVKIDRSFVSRMKHHRADMEVVRAIAAITRNLGMEVIGEGIESLGRGHLPDLGGMPPGTGMAVLARPPARRSVSASGVEGGSATAVESARVCGMTPMGRGRPRCASA